MNSNSVMQVFTGDAHDGCHMLDDVGAYEWWYVDAISDDANWSMVVIMFRGMPMSPDYLRELAHGHSPRPIDHCGVAVSVYYKGKRLFQVFRGVDKVETSFATSACDVHVGPCSLRNTAPDTWSLHVDTRHASTSRGIVLSATLRRIGAIVNDPIAFTARHGWVLAAPLATIQAQMEIHDFGRCRTRVQWSGQAYHDHNMGRVAMQEDFRSWYWGRALQSNNGFVYLATNDATEPFAFAAQVDEQGVHPWHRVQIRPKNHYATYMGLRASKNVVVDALEGSVQINQQRVLDDGPFYRRYLASVTGPFGTGNAITEDMHVQKYRAAWIRPFLRTPWAKQ